MNRLSRLGEKLGCHVWRQVGVLARCFGDVPRVSERVGDRHSEQRRCRHVPKAWVDGAIESALFRECCKRCSCRIIERSEEIAVRGTFTGLGHVNTGDGRPCPVLCTNDVVDELADIPVLARGVELELIL